MNSAAESGPAGPAEIIPAAPERAASGKKRWRRSRWVILIALAFGFHVGLVFTFGARKTVIPQAAPRIPRLQLADHINELVTLNDPTLFALPHPMDLMRVLRTETSELPQPSFRWTEPDGWLSLPVENLGGDFNRLMQTNRFAGLELQLKPPLVFGSPALPIEPVLPHASRLQVADGLG